MKVITHMQGSPQWLDWRRSGLGGSDIATCMGAKAFKTRKQLFYDKSALSDDESNSFMRRGQLYEGEALLTYCIDFNCHLNPICLESEVNPIWRASLDGYGEIDGEKVVLEIKVPTNMKLYDDAKNGIIPDNYHMQIQWQMMIGEAAKGVLMVYKPEDESYALVEVKPDLELQKSLQEAANEFWSYFLKGEIMPDGLETLEDDELASLIKEYDKLKVQENEIADSLKSIGEKIKSYAKEDGFRCSGYTCRLTPGRATYDYKSMSADGVNIDNYKKMSKETYTLRKEK